MRLCANKTVYPNSQWAGFVWSVLPPVLDNTFLGTSVKWVPQAPGTGLLGA